LEDQIQEKTDCRQVTKVKICIVSPYDLFKTGGVTDHVKNLAKELANLSHEVTIIAPCSKKKNRLGKVKLINVGSPIPVSFGSTAADICVSLRSILKVRSIFKKTDFDFVHIHEPLVPFVSISSLIFAKNQKILTFHASFKKSWIFKFWGFLFSYWINRDHRFIAVSEVAANSLKNYGLNVKPEIIPNGVDFSRFERNKKSNNEFTRILFVGRNEYRKGVKTLLQAFSKLIDKYENLSLILVGFGIDKLKKNYKNLPNCSFHPHKEDKELVDMFHNADIFCSPAIENESFGIVLLEAMASRLPVIASDIPGYREIIKDYSNGILFTPGNYDSLATKIEEIITDLSLRKRLSQQGQKYSRRFSWNTIAKKIYKQYQMGFIDG